FWDIIKQDLVKAVEWFWDISEISKGCNASFITLIPKVTDPIGLSDVGEKSKASGGKEGLNAMVNEAVTKAIFNGVQIGFEKVSGLKVNLNKSIVYSLGVDQCAVERMARWMGCSVGELPLTYLGLPIGAKVGGDLWVMVLKSLYGREGVLGEFVRKGDGVRGVWGDIVRAGRDIDRLGIEFSLSFVRKVGDGSCIYFWEDRWVDGVRLMDRFPRLFHLDKCKESVVADKKRWDEGTWRWGWDWVREPMGKVWVLDDSDTFTVKALSGIIIARLRGIILLPKRCTRGHHRLLAPNDSNQFTWRFVGASLQLIGVRGKPTSDKSAKRISRVVRWPRADACPSHQMVKSGFENLSPQTVQDRSNFSNTRVSRLSEQEAKRREVKFSEKEIWDAVTDPIGLSDVGGKSKASSGEVYWLRGSVMRDIEGMVMAFRSVWGYFVWERMGWMGVRLMDRFPRLFHLDKCKESVVADKGRWDEGTWRWVWDWLREPMGKVVGELEALEQTMSNTNITLDYMDTWKWMLDDSDAFPVKALSDLVEVKCINTRNHNSETIWNNLVTKKVNIFAWRPARGRLSVRVELDKKGIDLHMILCPNCDEMCETIDHSLIFCNEAMNVWEKVFEW
ncbi:RNA-directed DNA polymerase, eukaryota, reverse transcriptase zinc-binding domain protein, partial [Tanacetum coccineum]